LLKREKKTCQAYIGWQELSSGGLASPYDRDGRRAQLLNGGHKVRRPEPEAQLCPS
jgi:hypothetical protein